MLKQVNTVVRDYALVIAGQLRLTQVANDADSIVFRRMLAQYTQARLAEFGQQAARLGYQYAYTAYAAGWYGRLWMLDQASHHDPRVKPRRMSTGKAAQAVLQPGMTEAVDNTAYEYAGNEWRDIYATAVIQSTLKIKRMINTTVQAPSSVLAVTQDIASALGVDTPPKEAAKGLYHAVSLPTRTAVMRSANHASADVYGTHTEMLLGAMVVSSHDDRVCPICQRLDGRIFVINSLVGIALLGLPPDGTHLGCRCSVIPMMLPYESPNDPPDDVFDDWLDEYGFMDELDLFMQDDMLESTQL
jgi:SPP1 gp7 family putative phage head morphogenesis protein